MKKRGLKRTSGIFAAGILLLLSTIILTPISSQAQTNRYWIGGNEEYGYQMWYIPENWQDDDGDQGMPLPGNNAYVDTPGAQVAYNYWYSSGNLNYLRIDNDSTLFYVGFGRLPVLNTDVGYDSTGTFQLAWSEHNVQGSLVLGVNSGSTGIYEISSGALNVGLNTIVGNEGIGTFTQSDGTATVNGNLYLGNNWGSEGTYNLSGDPATSILTVGGSTIVGNEGTGVFNQTGGTHTIDGGLVLGQWSGSSGTYNLSGTGKLSMAGDMYIGVEGKGSFTQSGSSIVEANNIFLGTSGGSGSYELKGGNLSLTGVALIGYNATGTFTQTGGTHTIAGDLILGDQAGSSGTYNLSGDPSLVTLSVGGNTIVGNWGTGTFTQSGGTHTISGDLYLGYNRDDSDPLNPIISNGTYNLSGDSSVSLWVGGNELIGWGGTGAFTQTGGTHTVMGDLNLGQGEGTTGTFALSNGDLNVDGSLNIGHDGLGKFTQYSGTNKVGYNLVLGNNPTGDGTYTMEGGSLSTHRVEVGLRGKGTFTQTGGIHTTDGVVLGQRLGSNGTYNLSGTGKLSMVNDMYIGVEGTGSFIQDGSSTVEARNIFLGTSGGSGSYELKGGNLSLTGVALIGYNATGTFTQTGGTHTIGGDLKLGHDVGSSGTYNLSGTGVLNTRETIVGYEGTGTFNQNGGEHVITNSLSVGGGPYATPGLGIGTYNFQNGSLSTKTSNIGFSGSGTFTQANGTHTVTDSLAVGLYDTGVGQYTLNNGTINAGDMTVGDSGIGTFTQNGGTVTVEQTLFIGRGYSGSNPGDGTYNLKDGSLKTGDVWISPGGTGTFNQSGGIHTVNSNLTIDSGTNGIGTYKMMGGILNAVNIINNGAFNFTGGTLSPGLSPGTLNFVGNYIQGDLGKLLIELAGYEQGTEYDFLNITGKATLGGTLDIDLLPGFDPIMGSIFNILHAEQGVSGKFAFLDLPLLGGGKGWEINYLQNDVTVHVTPVPSTLLLLGSGLIGIVGLMRRKLKK